MLPERMNDVIRLKAHVKCRIFDDCCARAFPWLLARGLASGRDEIVMFNWPPPELSQLVWFGYLAVALSAALVGGQFFREVLLEVDHHRTGAGVEEVVDLEFLGLRLQL